MPKDSSGRPHTGTFGLFDDVDEVPRPRAAHIDAIEMQGVPRQHRWYHGNKEARMSRQAGLRQVDPQEVAEARTSRLLSMVFVGGKDDRLPGGNDDMKEEGAPEKEQRVQSMVGVPDVRVVGVEEEPGAFKSHTRNVASSLGGDLMSHRRNVPGRAGDLANQTRSVVVGGSGGQMHSGSIAGPGRHMHSGSVAGVGRHMHSGSIAGPGRHMHSGSVAGVGGHARTGSVVVGGGHSHMRSVVGRSGLAYNQTGSVYGYGNTRSVIGGGVGSVYGGRGPIGPDYVYREGEVEVLDSPWLKECGMVRVKSSLPGGCEIVPKNMLTRGD